MCRELIYHLGPRHVAFNFRQIIYIHNASCLFMEVLMSDTNSVQLLTLCLQLLFVSLITMTVFFRSVMHHDTVDDGFIYIGALYFALIMILFNGFSEVAMLVAKLPVLYKQRDLHFYPCWVYTLPAWILSIPTSLVESAMWVAVTYYVVGFDPQITRSVYALKILLEDGL